MGKSPKIPAAPPPAPTPPSFASSFLNRGSKAMASMGGTFLTQGLQPLIGRSNRKKVLG